MITKCEECRITLAVEDKDNYECWKCNAIKSKKGLNNERKRN